MRRAVAEERFAVPPEHSLLVTCSLGVAALTAEMGVLELVDCADQALFAAKRSGKNRVCFPSP